MEGVSSEFSASKLACRLQCVHIHNVLYAHVRTHMYAHVRTHMYAHVRTHMYAHVRTHACSCYVHVCSH